MIYVASDHAGFLLKKMLKDEFTLTDIGVFTEDKKVDYPDFASKLCDKISDGDFGILICGSGQGMAMAANRNKHIRACLCQDSSSVQLARQHNNANVLCLGSRVISFDQAREIVQVFLNTDFEGGRHLRRISKF